MKVMDGMFPSWMEKHKRSVGSSLRLDERPVMHLHKIWEGFRYYILPPYTPEIFLCNGYKLMGYGLMLTYINGKSCLGMDVICLDESSV